MAKSQRQQLREAKRQGMMTTSRHGVFDELEHAVSLYWEAFYDRDFIGVEKAYDKIAQYSVQRAKQEQYAMRAIIDEETY